MRTRWCAIANAATAGTTLLCDASTGHDDSTAEAKTKTHALEASCTKMNSVTTLIQTKTTLLIPTGRRPYNDSRQTKVENRLKV